MTFSSFDMSWAPFSLVHVLFGFLVPSAIRAGRLKCHNETPLSVSKRSSPFFLVDAIGK